MAFLSEYVFMYMQGQQSVFGNDSCWSMNSLDSRPGSATQTFEQITLPICAGGLMIPGTQHCYKGPVSQCTKVPGLLDSSTWSVKEADEDMQLLGPMITRSVERELLRGTELVCLPVVLVSLCPGAEAWIFCNTIRILEPCTVDNRGSEQSSRQPEILRVSLKPAWQRQSTDRGPLFSEGFTCSF